MIGFNVTYTGGYLDTIMTTKQQLQSFKVFSYIMFAMSIMFHLVPESGFSLYGNIMLALGVFFQILSNLLYAQFIHFKFYNDELTKFIIRLIIFSVGDLIGRYWLDLNFPFTLIPIGVFLLLYAAYLRSRKQNLEMHRF